MADRLSRSISGYGFVPSIPYVSPADSGVTTGTAAPTNSVNGPTLSSLATHTLPDPSIAMPYGANIPRFTYPFAPLTATPAELISLMLSALPPLFAAHTLPAPSIAIPYGKFRPPPVHPLVLDTAPPVEFSSLRLPLPPRFV